MRQEIEDGYLAAPRYRATGPEITVTGGLGDERKQHMHAESFGMIADGPDEIRRGMRGRRVVVGGDYGFTMTPMGQNARDIDHFVKFFGYSPAEALECATAMGGDLISHKGEFGVIIEEALADLLLVDGDPLQDQSVLVGPDGFSMIMKDGAMHRDPRSRITVPQRLTAE